MSKWKNDQSWEHGRATLREQSLFRAGEGVSTILGGMASFFLDSSDILKLLSTQFFPLSEIKDAQCSNLCISQVIQKAEFAWRGPAIYFTGDLIKKNSFTYSFQIPCVRIPPVEPGRRFQADPERFKSTNVGRNHRKCYCAEKEEFLKSAIEYYTPHVNRDKETALHTRAAFSFSP